MYKVLSISILCFTVLSCKKEDVKPVCYKCVATIEKLEKGISKTTTRTVEQEFCTEVAKNVFMDSYRFTTDYGTYVEFSKPVCNQK